MEGEDTAHLPGDGRASLADCHDRPSEPAISGVALRPAIPRRVALQRSPLPLHRISRFRAFLRWGKMKTFSNVNKPRRGADEWFSAPRPPSSYFLPRDGRTRISTLPLR